MDAGKDIFVAILIYSVGRFIIKQISVLIAKVLEKRKIETSVQTFLKSLVKILLNMVLAFAIISKLGVETTSFAALLASAGVAVGMENLYLFYCTTYSRSIYIIAYFKRFKNKYNQTTCEIGKIAGKCHTYSHTG